MAVTLFRKSHPEPEFRVGEKTLEEATALVRSLLSEPEIWSEEERARIASLQKESKRGNAAAADDLRRLIAGLLDRFGVAVPGMDSRGVAWEIYKCSWGLDVLEELYLDPGVDEIEVNDYGEIFTIRRGRHVRENVRFASFEAYYAVIKRLFGELGDLTASTPRVRTERAGARILATGPPFSSTYTLTIRKHGTFVYSRESLKAAGTMEDRIYDCLVLFNRGLLNMVYVGPTNAGKTSVLRHFFGFSPPDIRTVVIEPRFELNLRRNYPGRNIVEFQEVPGRLTMLDAFETTLQITPTRIVVGEILGGREAHEAVKAGVRGHTGNLTTFHAEDAMEALEGIAAVLAEEGRSQRIDLDIIRRRVAKAFDVVVTIASPPNSGVKKVVQVAEPSYREGDFELRELARWEPAGEEDFLEGRWAYPNPISERLARKLFRNGIPYREMREACLL